MLVFMLKGVYLQWPSSILYRQIFLFCALSDAVAVEIRATRRPSDAGLPVTDAERGEDEDDDDKEDDSDSDGGEEEEEEQSEVEQSEAEQGDEEAAEAQVNHRNNKRGRDEQQTGQTHAKQRRWFNWHGKSLNWIECFHKV